MVGHNLRKDTQFMYRRDCDYCRDIEYLIWLFQRQTVKRSCASVLADERNPDSKSRCCILFSLRVGANNGGRHSDSVQQLVQSRIIPGRRSSTR